MHEGHRCRAHNLCPPEEGLCLGAVCFIEKNCNHLAHQPAQSEAQTNGNADTVDNLDPLRAIDTLEAAAAFIHSQNVYYSRLGKLMRLLQIRGRSLTAGEEKYARSWLDMGLDDEAIAMAYERTCLNTGGLSWAYMHKILLRWQQAGYHTAADIRAGDKKPGAKTAGRDLDAEEQAAIARMLQEG